MDLFRDSAMNVLRRKGIVLVMPERTSYGLCHSRTHFVWTQAESTDRGSIQPVILAQVTLLLQKHWL
jgi:hypothetical protein